LKQFIMNTSSNAFRNRLRPLSSCIRTQNRPDPCLDGISTQNHVYNEIEKIKRIQNLHTENSSLYMRDWVSLTDFGQQTQATITKNNETNDECTSTILPHKGKDESITTTTFTALQFNILAEGLSSGPNALKPFNENNKGVQKKDQNTPSVTGKEENKRSYIYGGFTDIPKPEISLDFNLRKWRILEALIGKNVYRHARDSQNNKFSSSKNKSKNTIESNSDIAGNTDSLFDLIAIEEIDRYHGFFKPTLEIFGYDSIFYPKAYAPGIDSGWYSDGCALFWKRSAFQLVKNREVRTGTYEVGNQCYIVATLQHVVTNQELIVAVTHLKAQNSLMYEEIRTTQVKQLMEIIKEEQASGIAACSENDDSNITNECDIPIIILGDFNAEPKPQYEDKPKTKVNKNDDLNCDASSSCIQSLLQQTSKPRFTSAYPIDLSLPGINFYTTWKTRGKSTVMRVIDYIFYNKQDFSDNVINCTHVLAPPCETEMEPTHLPGFRYPSDHIAIGAKFKLSSKL